MRIYLSDGRIECNSVKLPL